MEEKRRAICLIVFMGGLLYTISFLCLIKTPTRYSLSERRLLQQIPALSIESLLDGSFMEKAEAYTQDQFPFRESFRSLKANVATQFLRRLDNNGIYYTRGHLGKLDYPLKKEQLQHAADRIGNIYDTYLAGKKMNCYLAIIPDKNYYLARTEGYPTMDYEVLYTYMKEELSQMAFIELRNLLSVEDFYFTDTHWRQERLLLVAEKILEAMGNGFSGGYKVSLAKEDFFGVYTGQSALKTKGDELFYLTKEELEDCLVTSYDTGAAVQKSVYDTQKLEGKDAYEFFLSGSQALLTIENPHAEGKGELILFRDSFGSSLAPLLVEEYEKITLVDIRYIDPSILEEFIRFEQQDVLFLYSTLLLNNSLGMK